MGIFVFLAIFVMIKRFRWGERQQRWIFISYIFYIFINCLKRRKCPSFNGEKWMELTSWMKNDKILNLLDPDAKKTNL
ncbi:hypothetical protein Hanom_Chr08g00756561 [Helianthus anomalus]